jgi:signal transduction histidine kinase/DNA-binding CsgD family transcriptional regulator
MTTSDTLLQLVSDLQKDVTATEGRRRLLEYIRTITGTRLALLFTFDAENHALTLLERCGYRFQQAYRAAFTAGTASELPAKRINAKHIPEHGLFGSALDTTELLYVPRADLHARCLREEQFWIGPHGSVFLGRVVQQGKPAGVLVLSYGLGENANLEHEEETDARRLAPEIENELLICLSLLPAYLATFERKKQKPVRSSSKSAQQCDPRSAIDEERERIARDIHDGAAQHMGHVIHKLTFISRILEKQPATARRELSSAVHLLQEGLDELRHTIMSPSPVRLEKQGLAAALHELIEGYRRDEPSLNIDLLGDDFTLVPQALEATLYRFVQEALANVRKHAQATHAVVRIRVLAGLLLVEVSDDGRGFDLQQSTRRTGIHASIGLGQQMGLRTMRERVKQAGGNWEITSKHGAGTTVKARFPLSMPSPAAILTRRERGVLQLLVEGLSNKEIAERLSVSPETVKSHIHHILQKMQVHDRTQAAVAATRQKWV